MESIASKELRLNVIYEMIMEGKPKKNIIERLKNEFGIYQTTAYKDIREAEAKIAAESTNNLKEIFITIYHRFEDLYGRAYTVNDWEQARKVLDSMCKMIPFNRMTFKDAEEPEDFTIYINRKIPNNPQKSE
jgi:hypothetical protein